MGTYTANKNLFMPTVGETGWGTLVNNNFSTIDNFLKPISLSGSTYTFTGNHVGNQSGGSVSATSITNSGTLTQKGTSTFTGKITANGGLQGNVTGTVTGNLTGDVTASNIHVDNIYIKCNTVSGYITLSNLENRMFTLSGGNVTQTFYDGISSAGGLQFFGEGKVIFSVAHQSSLNYNFTFKNGNVVLKTGVCTDPNWVDVYNGPFDVSKSLTVTTSTVSGSGNAQFKISTWAFA